MNIQLEKQLADKFPFMAHGGEPCFCAVGDGWYSVLEGLCAEIVTIYEKANTPPDIEIVQIKEKYGTLRFYCIFKKNKKPTGETIQLHNEVLSIIHRWEDKSATICEECGSEGKLRTDLSWFSTLCDECYSKAKQQPD